MPVSNIGEVSTLQYEEAEQLVEAPKEYLATEYMINEETGLPIGEEAPEAKADSSYDIDELAKKLGIDPSKISELVDAEKPPDDTTKEEGKEPEKEAEEETEEAIKKRLAVVDTELKSLLGAGLTDVYGMLRELTEFRNQYYTEQQLNTLKSEWGNTYDDNMKMVHEKWSTLPDDRKAALNNVDGARLLLALIEKEKQTGKVDPRITGNPKYVKGTSSGTGSQAKLKMSDIMKMSEAEYRKNEPVIQKAIREGRVIKDY